MKLSIGVQSVIHSSAQAAAPQSAVNVPDILSSPPTASDATAAAAGGPAGGGAMASLFSRFRVAKGFARLINPMNLRYSRADIERAGVALEDHKSGRLLLSEPDADALRLRLRTCLNDGLYNDALENQKLPVSEAVSYAWAPAPFRWSSFVPANAAVAYSLLLKPTLGVLERVPAWARFIAYNGANRVYCFAFDWYQRGVASAKPGLIDPLTAAAVKPKPKQMTDDLPRLIGGSAVTLTAAYFIDRTGTRLSASMAAAAAGPTAVGVGAGVGAGPVAVALPLGRIGKVLRGISPRVREAAMRAGTAGAVLSVGHAVDLTLARYEEVLHGSRLHHRVTGPNGAVSYRLATDAAGNPLTDRKAGITSVASTLLQRVSTAWFVLATSSFAVERTERLLGQRFASNPRLVGGAKLLSMAAACWAAVPLTQAVCVGDPWKANANGLYYYNGT